MVRCRTLLTTALVCLAACTGGAAPEAKKEEAKAEAPKAAPAAKVEAPKPEIPPELAAEKLLAEVVEAAGGAAKFDAIKSYTYEMKVEIVGSGIAGTGKAWAKEGDFYLEIALPGVGTSVAGGRGGKLWTQDPIQGLRALSGKEAEMAAMGASLNLAHDWRRFFDKAETTAVAAEGGKQYADVTLTAKSGNSVTLRIDLESKRVVLQKTKQYSSMGEIPVDVAVEDYRQQDGVWLSFAQTADMKLQKMRTEVTKLELNVPVDESKFALPGSEPPPETKAAETKAGEAKAAKPAK